MRCAAFVLSASVAPSVLAESLATLNAGLTGDDSLTLLGSNASQEILDVAFDLGVKTIPLSENYCFLAYNYAVEMSSDFEFACILNDDVIAKPNWLEKLIKGINIGKASIAGYEANNGVFDASTQSFRYLGRGIGKLPYLVGWCLLVRVKDFLRVGGFSISPFGGMTRLYAEDSELTFKMLANGMNAVLVTPPAIKHLGDSSSASDKRDGHDNNNRFVFSRWNGVPFKGSFSEIKVRD